MRMDLIGDSDPFCNLSVGCQRWQSKVNLLKKRKTKMTEKYQATEIKCPSITVYTKVVKRTLEPVWKEDWEVVVEEAMDQTLDLEMWDKVD